MCGLHSNGYTAGTNCSTNADYNNGINTVNIERHNDTNTDITIKISVPGISTIAFSGAIQIVSLMVMELTQLRCQILMSQMLIRFCLSHWRLIIQRQLVQAI